MKIKTEYLVLALVIAALSAYLVLQRQQQTTYRLPEVPAVAAGVIDRIEIDRPGQPPVDLRKQRGAWTVGEQGYAADADKIRGMLEILRSLDLTALVSESRSGYARYELDPAHRIRVRAWSEGTLRRDLAFGKAAATYRHTFVTLADDPNVYHAREDFRGRFDRTLDQLRDKRVLTFARDAVTALRIEGPEGQTAGFVRPPATKKPAGATDTDADAGAKEAPERVWRNADGRPADAETLKRLLTNLEGMECAAYRYDEPKAEWAARQAAYVIVLEDAQPHRLTLFPPEETGDGDERMRPGIASGTEDPFNLSTYLGDEIVADARKLLGLAKEAAPAEPDPPETGAPAAAAE